MQLLPIRPPEFDILLSIPRCFIRMSTPKVKDHYRMLITDHPKETAEYLISEYSSDKMPPLSDVTGADFIKNYAGALREYRERNMDIMQVPQTIDFSPKKKEPFPILTGGNNIIYEYSGLDFTAQQELLITEYWVILADAVKAKYTETEAGREYLEQAYADMHRINTLEANIR